MNRRACYKQSCEAEDHLGPFELVENYSDGAQRKVVERCGGCGNCVIRLLQGNDDEAAGNQP